MQLQVCKCECNTCDGQYYEWEDAPLDECPHCGADLDSPYLDGLKPANVIQRQLVVVELDLMTGAVSIPGA